MYITVVNIASQRPYSNFGSIKNNFKKNEFYIFVFFPQQLKIKRECGFEVFYEYLINYNLFIEW